MVKSWKKRIFDAGNASDEECIAGAFSIEKSPFSPSQEPEKTPEKHPYCVTEAQKGACMRTGLTKQEKTTDIWFDEKDPLIYIRTHNTDLKNRLTAYAAAHPGECRQTDADPETGEKAMYFIVIPALVIGLGYILYAQFKYNKGIF